MPPWLEQLAQINSDVPSANRLAPLDHYLRRRVHRVAVQHHRRDPEVAALSRRVTPFIEVQ